MDIVVNWMKGHLKLVIGLGALVGMLLAIVGIASSINSIDNEGFEKQRDVLQQYNIYQTELSTCLDNTNIASQIAVEEYQQVKDVFTAIVGARYGDEGALSEGGAFVSALQEQYPEIDRSLWKQLMTTAVGCRNQVAGVNNELQSVASRFDKWCNTGGLWAKMFRSRYPTDELKVMSFSGPVTGQAALDFLTTPITTSEATNAIRTHEMPTQDLFPGGDPSPSE